MAKKKHLKLLSSKRLGEVGKIKFKYGVPGKEEDDEEENTQPNYYKQASTLRVSIESFSIEQEQKYKQRSAQIEIPANIDYIQINFVSQLANFSTTTIKCLVLKQLAFSILANQVYDRF